MEHENLIEQKLKNWVDQFSQIPGVKAEEYKGEEVNYLIDISFSCNLKTFIRETDTKNSTIIIALKVDGTFEERYTDGENDLIYIKWQEEMLNSNERTWEDLYKWVVELSNRYEQAVVSFK
jgi:hypothetical protein